MNDLIRWDEYPLAEVVDVLIRDCTIDGKPITRDDLPDIMPRAAKDFDEKISRTRTLAEVFTPSDTVKFMVDALDDRQLDSRWLEVACGEAPFITNRYDATTGEVIPFDRRTGILDRKLRAINGDKISQALRAIQSVYGYELQGDSLIIARANVLLTFAEFARPPAAMLNEAAQIVAQNFWQMDAYARYDIFNQSPLKKIRNWFVKGADPMKFDFVISNPPYQDDTPGGNKNFSSPVYHHFMRECRKIADKTLLITPARFLFNAGGTPKKFNNDMLKDKHFKVLHYEPDAKKVFRNVDIEGGVVITLYDNSRTFEPIDMFIPYDELRNICEKVITRPDFVAFGKIISGRTPYLFTEKFHEDFPDAASRLSKGHAYDISSNVFELLPEIFLPDSPNDDADHCRILGRLNNNRTYRRIDKRYVRGRVADYIGKWKIFLPKANGASGKLGDKPARLISKPVIGAPSEVATDTFITAGAFDTLAEADACLKYIKSKFARVMLGILKITQDNTADKWSKVPLQNFTSASDIDWSLSIAEIDAQLYRKYNLSDAEINFIEAHVKEMA